ncbi:MAG TPA: hypothetical protein V6D17_21870 [Candidatus Obscuribacterales bacterium]
MGKSYRNSKYREESFDDDTVYVSLDEIHICESTIEKLLARDGGQIEKMRQDFEFGRASVRVVLRPRAGGGYNIEDGRHRVIAAKLAGMGFIEALVVGR